jgi:hypothetical protein
LLNKAGGFMANILLKYFLEKFDTTIKPNKEPGPVVTISRELGCSGKRVAAKICEILNQKNREQKINVVWKCINSEIIAEAANELNLKPKLIKQSFNVKQKSIVEDLLSSFLDSRNNNEIKIKKTIADILNSFAYEGHKIIIGRGGAVLTQNYTNAIHVKLYAPLEWKSKKN